jgi:Rv0078B-related antitoxin
VIPAEGLQKQIEVYRRMTGRQRLQIGFELYELAHEMVRCGVRQQHPEWDARQVTQEVLRRFGLAERLP